MSLEDNFPVWDGRASGHYEVYFLKFNDPGRKIAAWIRYTLLSPRHGPAVAEVWGFFFDRDDPGRNLAVKDTYPATELALGKDPLVRISSSVLRHGEAQGKAGKNGRDMVWQLRWDGTGQCLYHFPYRWMYRAPFPRTKVLSPWPDARVSGTLEVGGRSYRFDGAPGQQSHLWGSGYADRWTWCHCNAFDEEDAVLEALSARIRIGPVRLPPLTIFLLNFRGRLYRLNSLGSMVHNRSRSNLGRWEFEGKGENVAIRGEVAVDPRFMLGAGYTGPSGEKRWCHNSKVADIELRVALPGSPPAILTARGTCAAEWVEKYQDQRVPLWI